MKRKNVFSIIIPTWNAAELLKKNLPLVLQAAGEEIEVLVVDNGSTDESLSVLDQISQENPDLKLIKLEKNYGFSYACNLGVKKALGEIAVLLNNDVIPEKGFLKPLVRDFSDQKTFAVSLCEPQFSWAWGKWEDGFLSHGNGPKEKSSHLSFWASGGSAAFRKRIWVELGGFDKLYDPFYWEDVDLSYRAWKRGYQILWEPLSVVFHRHEATVGRFPKKYINFISQRNELLFIWKNIISGKMINEHKNSLVKKMVKNMGYIKVVLAALSKLPEVIKLRNCEKLESKITDEKIFSYFSNN